MPDQGAVESHIAYRPGPFIYTLQETYGRVRVYARREQYGSIITASFLLPCLSRESKPSYRACEPRCGAIE